MSSELTVQDPDGLTTVVLRWPSHGAARGVLQILHGWAEHASRYDRPARAFAASGFVVYADDHRGHGQTGVRSGTLGDVGPRGLAGVTDAVHAVSERIRAEEPGLPLFVLGHSWGSFILRDYVRRWGHEIAGALFTGTTMPGGDPAPATLDLANSYDWLTRDTAEVQKYVDDPLCGFQVMKTPPVLDVGSMLGADDALIPASLPILVFNGADDPIGGAAGGRRLADHFSALGITDVTFRAYDGARHELFNETNRDEVVADVIAWLSDRC